VVGRVRRGDRSHRAAGFPLRAAADKRARFEHSHDAVGCCVLRSARGIRWFTTRHWRGDRPYGVRKTRPKLDASVNPQRRAIAPIVSCDVVVRLNSSRHSSSRWVRIQSPSDMPPSARTWYRWRTEMWCAAAIGAAFRPGSDRCARAYSSTRSCRVASVRGRSAGEGEAQKFVVKHSRRYSAKNST